MEGVAEINRIEEMGDRKGGDRGAGLHRFRFRLSEWGACAVGRWFYVVEEAYGMLITVVQVVKICCCWRWNAKKRVASCRENKCAGVQKRTNGHEKYR